MSTGVFNLKRNCKATQSPSSKVGRAFMLVMPQERASLTVEVTTVYDAVESKHIVDV